MADGEVRAQDLAQETASTLSGNEQFVMFDSTAGKRADIDDVATYVAGDKTTLKTTNKTSPVAAINENFDAIADVKEDINNSYANLKDVQEMAHNSANLIDQKYITNNAILTAQGGISQTGDNYTVSDFIPVNGKNIAGNFAKSNGVFGIAVYNEKLEFIRIIYGASLTKYEYQVGDSFVRFGFYPAAYGKQICVYGNDFGIYTPYSSNDKRISQKYRQVYKPFDKRIDSNGTITYRGFATRYNYSGFVTKIGIHALFRSTYSQMTLFVKIWDGTFTNVLFSGTVAVKPDQYRNQWAFVNIPSGLFLSGDFYIGAYAAYGEYCTTPANGTDKCTANDTYKNKYLLASSQTDTWGSIAGKTYCLDIALYDTITGSYNSSQNIVYIGTSAGCDYPDIQSALDDITDDTPANRYVLKVMSGVYSRISCGIYNSARNVDIVGEDVNSTIISSNTGAYWEPAAEITINGTIKNITFSHLTDADHYSPSQGHDSAYALHSDFAPCSTRYENCVFKCNAGPAVGLGLWNNSHIEFINCQFLCTADGTFGSGDFGGIFAHTDTVTNSKNQYLLIKDSLSVSEYGTAGCRLTVPDTGRSGSEYKYYLQGFASYKANGVPNMSIYDPDGTLFGYYCYNNVPQLP